MRKRLASILGIIDGYTEVLEGARVIGRGKRGSQNQEVTNQKETSTFHCL